MEHNKIIAYSRQQVADMLGVSLSTVGNLVNDGQIYSVRIGGKIVRVPDWAVDDYLAGRPAYQPDNPMLERDGELEPTESIFTKGQEHDEGS